MRARESESESGKRKEESWKAFLRARETRVEVKRELFKFSIVGGEVLKV